MPLSDIAIRNAKPKDKPYKLYDANGLFLLVTPSGGKWWRLKYRLNGKEKLLSLGTYPVIGLKEARIKRDETRQLIAQGVNPGERRREAKAIIAAMEKEKETTFSAVAREWFAKKRAAWTDGHQKKILSRLENQLFPYIGERQFSSLEAADYLAVIQKAESRGAIETAHRLAQLCGQITRYARIAGVVAHDAATGLNEALAPVKTKHYAAIVVPSEMGELLRSIDEYPGEPVLCYALKLLPYVFVRSGELRGAAWDEIDFDAAEWVIPAGRMKMRRPHVVPLARQAIALFRSLKELSGNGALVFPSSFSATRCISDVGLLNALRRMGYGKDKMTIHGFRTSASTMLNELGYNKDWIEAQLAHAEKNAVRDAYNRAEYLPERRKMMQEWADYLDNLKAG